MYLGLAAQRTSRYNVVRLTTYDLEGFKGRQTELLDGIEVGLQPLEGSVRDQNSTLEIAATL